LRREGSESRDVNLGRGMLADPETARPAAIPEGGTYGLGCAAKSA
jgi:hypothetical protein